jgi:hypothetical protein
MGFAQAVVIIEPDTPIDGIQQRVEALLDLFDADKEVEPYEGDCDCVLYGTYSKGLDPPCSECGGSGTVLTTRNPRAGWEWYLASDWWDRAIVGERDWQMHTTSFDGVDTVTSHKLAVVRNIPLDFEAYVIITPDDDWHGDVYGLEEATWAKEKAALFESYRDHLAVGIELHYY